MSERPVATTIDTTTTTTTTAPTSTPTPSVVLDDPTQIRTQTSILRRLFPDKETVFIYPDDFIIDVVDTVKQDGDNNHHNTNNDSPAAVPSGINIKKDIIFSDLINRSSGHFSDRRIVVFFRPGKYHDINFPVGYWTHVVGLGQIPKDVTFTGTLGVYAIPANTSDPKVGSLDTFWRCAENFHSETTFLQHPVSQKWCIPIPTKYSTTTTTTTTTTSTLLYPVNDLTDEYHNYPPHMIPNFSSQKGMMWAVSQASPLRRISIGDGGNLHLAVGEHRASGGFMSNVNISDGYLLFGSQQQFCIRNSHVSHKAAEGAWSFVFIGSNSTHNNNGCAAAGTSGTATMANTTNTTTTFDDENKNDAPKRFKQSDDDLSSSMSNGEVEWAQPDRSTNNNPPTITHETYTETRIEKPFLFEGSDDDQKLYLGIPKIQKYSIGIDHDALDSTEERVWIHEVDPTNTHNNNNTTCMVKVVAPNDSYVDIQDAASKGKHIVLNPGTYCWNKTLTIATDNQVVLGIGMATIQAPDDGSPCIYIRSSTKGVRLSGLSLEASAITTYSNSTLLLWGEENEEEDGAGEELPSPPLEGSSTSTRPAVETISGAIHDLYCFVGGRSLDRTVAVETMVKIYSSNVIGDNLWLWRADHVKLRPGELPNKPKLSEYHVTTFGECRCDVGLEVYGDNVTMNGLAVEHTYKDMVKWHGKNGKAFFYQSELPYDVSGQVYSDFVGYRVLEGADNHVAKGIGIYSNFRDHDDVVVDTAVMHHASKGRYENVFTVRLDGKCGIRSIINRTGQSTDEQGHAYVVPVFEVGARGS
jgi:hypothetical protein